MKDRRLGVNNDLVRNPTISGSAGIEKLCLLEGPKDVWVARYMFGIVPWSEEDCVINEIYVSLKKDKWKMGAAHTVGRLCKKPFQVIMCLAYSEAYLKAYLQRERDANVKDFFTDVRSKRDDVIAELKKSYYMSDWMAEEADGSVSPGFDQRTRERLEIIFAERNFRKLPCIDVGAEL